MRKLAVILAILATFICPPANSQSILPGENSPPIIVQSVPVAAALQALIDDLRNLRFDRIAPDKDALLAALLAVPDPKVRLELALVVIATADGTSIDRADLVRHVAQVIILALSRDDAFMEAFAKWLSNQTGDYDPRAEAVSSALQDVLLAGLPLNDNRVPEWSDAALNLLWQLFESSNDIQNGIAGALIQRFPPLKPSTLYALIFKSGRWNVNWRAADFLLDALRLPFLNVRPDLRLRYLRILFDDLLAEYSALLAQFLATDMNDHKTAELLSVYARALARLAQDPLLLERFGFFQGLILQGEAVARLMALINELARNPNNADLVAGLVISLMMECWAESCHYDHALFESLLPSLAGKLPASFWADIVGIIRDSRGVAAVEALLAELRRLGRKIPSDLAGKIIAMYLRVGDPAKAKKILEEFMNGAPDDKIGRKTEIEQFKLEFFALFFELNKLSGKYLESIVGWILGSNTIQNLLASNSYSPLNSDLAAALFDRIPGLGEKDQLRLIYIIIGGISEPGGLGRADLGLREKIVDFILAKLQGPFTDVSRDQWLAVLATTISQIIAPNGLEDVEDFSKPTILRMLQAVMPVLAGAGGYSDILDRIRNLLAMAKLVEVGLKPTIEALLKLLDESLWVVDVIKEVTVVITDPLVVIPIAPTPQYVEPGP